MVYASDVKVFLGVKRFKSVTRVKVLGTSRGRVDRDDTVRKLTTIRGRKDTWK